ncbi:TPA: tail fiber domain-containing protein [Bacillus cereus]
MSTVGTKVALGFNAGWNTVDILHGNRTGAPVMNLGVKLSTQVDKLTAVIGVGDKNDARLREAETSLKQTEESIKIMATKNEVTELGNKVESQSSSMEVLSNAIKSKVETERFNEYSDRLETTESSVEIIEGKIVNLVEKKDFDELNGKYSTQQTKIEQMDKSIGLKASNEKVDKLSGRVEVAEGAIEVANDKISLTVTGLDNLGKKTTAIEQDTGQIKQSVTNLSKSVTAQGTAIEEHSTSITSLNKSIALKAEADKVYTIEQANGKIAESATKLKSEIEVTTKGISQTVTDVKKDVDGMKTTVESQGTQIKQTAEEVAVNVVKKGNVKTSINASAEGVKILGKHLDITGAVTFQSLDPTMQDKVNAGTDAKNQIEGMQFGAKNIIRKKQITPINVASSSYDEATNTWTLIANSGAGGSWGAGVRITDKTSVVPIGSWFTISFEIYSPIDANWNADVNNFPVTGTSTTNDNDDIAMRKTSSKSLKANTWTKCWFTWKNKDNSNTDLYDQSNIGLVNNSGTPVTFKIRNVKGELGNVVTDFTLAQEDIDEMINNISFGGRNIFLNAGLLQGATNWYSNVAQTAVVDDGEDKAFKFTPNSGAGRAGIYQRLGGGVSATRVFEKDQEYTVSVMMKASTGSHKLQIGAESLDTKTVDVDTTWREYVHTFKGTGAGNGTVIFYTTAVVSGVDFFIKRMQLEKGNRKTDFTLAPEDYDKLLSEVNKKAQDSQNAIDNMSIGGNNLLLNSHADYSTTEYQIATYTLTENWVAGQEYTFVIKGTVPAGQKFGIWMNGGSSNVGYATTKYSEGVTYVTFKAVTPAGGHTKSLGLYNYPSNTTTSTVDWVALYKGNKPMDWTISSGDIQNLFTGVDEKATASKNAIADMSNDNKATPIEKQQLKKEWATITAEKPNYEALANTYGVTTEKTNYINAYNALNTAISPIISNASITSDINGATFRNTFDDYYDKQSQLVKKINELARSIGTSAESKAQSAQNSIADMSSDSKITPVEKVQLKKEWAVMVAEKPQFEALANGFGVTGEKNNYVNAYNTLNTALNGSGGILTNMTTTSSVNGATFRAQFDDYYDRKSQLVRKINELSKVLTQGLNGKVLYSDPMFRNGLNDVKVYNNSANSNVTINRVAKPSDAPTNSTHVLEVKSLALPISPSYGGFSFQTMSRANAIFVTRIVAKIPVGSKLVFASNSTGTGGKSEWLTPVAGTGKWEEYLFRLECGSTGTFSSTNFFNIEGGTLPLTWHIAYATVIDATDYDYSITDMSNDNKLTPLEKQQLKKEWATISAEKPQYEALSNTFGITTEKTNYVNSYNALNTFLSPLISNITTTSDVNGQTFRNTFDDYYDKKAQLVRKINELSRSIGTSADAKAQEVKNSIADMSSDSKITPVEKVQLKKEWAVMASEKPQYEVLATTYGIGAEKTNFVNAYNTLNTVLNGTGGILTNMATTSAVTGATFRGQFDDYYDKKSQLVKVINEKAKSLADSAQGTANGVNNTIKPWIFPNKTTINGAQIETGSVKAVQIDVANLFANTAFINNLKSQNISADKIVGGTIKGIRYESINASNPTIKLVLEGNSLKSYGAMDTTAKKQNYAEMKDGGISVFEMAESGSPFGDRKAYVEPARFNAQQGSSYSVALEPTELRFWVPNMTGTISYDVTGNTATGYGLRLEANGGILVKNKVDINHPAIQFENRESIFIDGWGNFQGGKYSTQYATWSMKDADGRIRMLIPMGKGTQAGNEYHSHAGGHKFFYNGSLGLSTYVQGGNSPIIQFNGQSILKYWGGGGYFEFKNQWDSGFVPVYASSFNTASSLIWKTDIESYRKSALDVVMGTNIVTYKYKSDVEESDNPHTHVGVIAEYAPKEIQSKDGRGVDNYAMSSLAWKAIQELSEQVRYLKEKINNR